MIICQREGSLYCFNIMNDITGQTIFKNSNPTYTKKLPKVTVWWDTHYPEKHLTGTERRQLFDTGFLGYLVSATTDGYLSVEVDGFKDMLDYLSKHPDIPVSLANWDNRCHWWSTTPTSNGFIWPPYTTLGCRGDGQHIGWEANETVQMSANSSTAPVNGTTFADWLKPKSFRYRREDGVAYPNMITPALVGRTIGPLVMPLHTDTIPFWEAAEEFTFTTGVGKAHLDKLSSIGVKISGMYLDGEDTPYHPDNFNEIKNLMRKDGRFPETTCRLSDWANYAIVRIFDARAYALSKLIKKPKTSESCFYGFGDPTYVRNIKPTHPIFWLGGEPIMSMCHYPFYSKNDPLADYSSLGRKVSEYAVSGVHLFHATTSAGLGNGPGFAIGPAIGWYKQNLTMGGYKLWLYVSDYSPKHTVYAALIAYNEAQKYYNFIKSGTNYIPPYHICRRWVYDPSIRTTWYGKDFNGTEIPVNVWISCRVHGNKALYCGTTTDGSTGSVEVLSPSGKKARVDADSYGKWTVISL